MSLFSGKCDLYDDIMIQHFRTKSGSDKKEDLDKANVYYSDELECFNEFKKKTGGVIYQHQEIKVTEQNQDLVAKLNGSFKIIELPLEENQRKHRYIYLYFGKEYKNLKEVNKKGIFITKEIHFNTLLDLIPYYPYLVTMSNSSNEKMTVYISQESFVDTQERSFLQTGIESTMYEYYKKELQKHYIEVVQKYYTPKQENIIFELVKFDENRVGKTQYPIDDRFEVKWFFKDKDVRYWSDPEVINYEEGLIEMSDQDYSDSMIDYRGFIGTECYVKYCKYEKPRLYLE